MIANTILAAAQSALKQFGTYTFDDKGPHEVMELDQFVEVLRKMPANEAAEAIRTVASGATLGGATRSARLASALIGEMEDWDELFEQDGITDIY